MVLGKLYRPLRQQAVLPQVAQARLGAAGTFAGKPHSHSASVGAQLAGEGAGMAGPKTQNLSLALFE
jgi:hypothetical protein